MTEFRENLDYLQKQVETLNLENAKLREKIYCLDTDVEMLQTIILLERNERAKDVG